MSSFTSNYSDGGSSSSSNNHNNVHVSSKKHTVRYTNGTTKKITFADIFVSTIDHLRSMDSHNFEILCGKVLEVYIPGSLARVFPPGPDGGADVIIESNNNGMYYKSVIQCKRYQLNSKISNEKLQRHMQVINDEEGDDGYFITTSDFTGPAKQLINSVEYKNKLTCWNGNEFFNLMKHQSWWKEEKSRQANNNNNNNGNTNLPTSGEDNEVNRLERKVSNLKKIPSHENSIKKRKRERELSQVTDKLAQERKRVRRLKDKNAEELRKRIEARRKQEEIEKMNNILLSEDTSVIDNRVLEQMKHRLSEIHNNCIDLSGTNLNNVGVEILMKLLKGLNIPI